MRSWVEKLANASKDRGVFCSGQINFDMYKWHTYVCDHICYVYISDEIQTISIKIYQDEYDLLSEIESIVRNNTKDDIMKKLENL
jgi:hypothetical protein